MPDIKTALEKALNEWEPEPMPETIPSKPYFTVTNNVTRITFEYIRDNPGKTRKEVCNALFEKGFKHSSTTTLIGQMIKQYHARESQGLLYATSDHYVPLKGAKAWANLQASAQRKHVTLVSKSTGKVLNPRPAPVKETPQINSAWDAETLLNNLSIKQARALYDELRKIFGG